MLNICGKIFQSYRKIQEVFIPAKRDKHGYRFGFAKLIDVHNVHILCLTRNKLFFGEKRLMVHLPRFAKGQKHETRRNEPQQKKKLISVGSQKKNALMVKINKVQHGSNNFYGLSFEVAVEDVRRLSQAYVARVSREGDAYITPKKVTYGRLVWDRERLIWIKCYDVLCHAWSEDFFEKLGLAYGAFMYTNEHIKDKEHLDIGKFVMKTTHNTVINEVVKVKINDNIFHIKLVKEGCKECLNYFGCRNRRHKDSATFEELEDYKEEDKLNNNEDGQVGDLIPNFNFEIQNEKARSGPKNTWFDLGPERLSGFGNKQGSPNPHHNCFRRSSFGV
ncbi:hypothetical protein JHK85_000514 [Glycine max]|nr:hypothetical protein JHK85_000514 [Glycine max]KAG5087893.1 hypothetical protein JHK86_000505 [Glycine max]